MLALLSRAWQTLGPEQMLGRGRLGKGVRSPLTPAGSRQLHMCSHEDREEVCGHGHGEEGGIRDVRWRGRRVRHVPHSRAWMCQNKGKEKTFRQIWRSTLTVVTGHRDSDKLEWHLRPLHTVHVPCPGKMPRRWIVIG